MFLKYALIVRCLDPEVIGLTKRLAWIDIHQVIYIDQE